MGLQAYYRVLNEDWYWYKFSDVVTLKGHDKGQKVKVKASSSN